LAKKTPEETPSEALTAPEIVTDAVVRKAPKNPLQPDRWLITPVSYKKNGEEKPSELIYYKNDVELAKIKVTQENFTELIEILHARFGGNTLVAEEWYIKTPPASPTNPEPDPVLSFASRGRLLMTLPMNQAFLKKFVKALDTQIVKPPVKIAFLGDWWAKHKFWRAVIVLMVLPVLVALVFAFARIVSIGA